MAFNRGKFYVLTKEGGVYRIAVDAIGTDAWERVKLPKYEPRPS
jgi:hypothetical protein